MHESVLIVMDLRGMKQRSRIDKRYTCANTGRRIGFACAERLKHSVCVYVRAIAIHTIQDLLLHFIHINIVWCLSSITVTDLRMLGSSLLARLSM